jgi:hypothetical protein
LESATAYAIVMQPNGAIVLGGSAGPYPDSIGALARYQNRGLPARVSGSYKTLLPSVLRAVGNFQISR